MGIPALHRYPVIFTRDAAPPFRAAWTGDRPADATLFVPRALPGSLTWEREMGLQLLRRYLSTLGELGYDAPVVRLAGAALASAPDDARLRRILARARARADEPR